MLLPSGMDPWDMDGQCGFWCPVLEVNNQGLHINTYKH